MERQIEVYTYSYKDFEFILHLWYHIIILYKLYTMK